MANQLWHAYEKKIGIFIERTTLCCLVALRETSSSRPMTRLNHQQWVHRQHHYIKIKRGRHRLELTRLRRDVSVNHRYSSLLSSHCVRTLPSTVWNLSRRAACSICWYIFCIIIILKSFFSQQWYATDDDDDCLTCLGGVEPQVSAHPPSNSNRVSTTSVKHR